MPSSMCDDEVRVLVFKPNISQSEVAFNPTSYHQQNPLQPVFFNAQYFHGMPDSAESRVRAVALLWNFCPSSPQTVRKHAGQVCPAARLNGTRYADNWLENLLVCGSMNGVEQDPQNPL